MWRNYNGLLRAFEKRLRRGRTVSNTKIQKLMLQAAIAYEYENTSEPSWDGGLSEISEHCYFLLNYFDVERLRNWVAARAEPEQPADAEADDLLQFNLFFLALCRSLQEGENNISPADAVCFGLINTVVARPAPNPLVR